MGRSQVLTWGRIRFVISNLSTTTYVCVFLAGFWLGTDYCFSGNGFIDDIPDIQEVEVTCASQSIPLASLEPMRHHIANCGTQMQSDSKISAALSLAQEKSVKIG